MYQNKLNELCEPAIWFRRQVGGKGSPSKLGGLPTLPPEIKWPRQQQSGTPLHFLAQIDLSRLPPISGVPSASGLPKSGMLFFFADIEEEMLWNENGGPFATTRVVLANHPGPERSPPDDIPGILHGFGEMAGGYETGITVYPHATLESHVIDTFGAVDPRSHDEGTYSAAAQAAMVESIERAIGPLPVFSGPASRNVIKATNPREYIQEIPSKSGGVRRRDLHCPLHQMFGIGKNVQGTAEDARANGTVLLLQIDSDFSLHPNFMFCDMGVAQFWIEPADLAKGRFDRAWGTTEGG
jgi:uncharacterized protein YwqG